MKHGFSLMPGISGRESEIDGRMAPFSLFLWPWQWANGELEHIEEEFRERVCLMGSMKLHISSQRQFGCAPQGVSKSAAIRS